VFFPGTLIEMDELFFFFLPGPHSKTCLKKKLDMMECACNPSTEEKEARGSSDQTGLHN
jgi:hypothetical protein